MSEDEIELVAIKLFEELDNAGFIQFVTDWDGLSGSAKERFRTIAVHVIAYADKIR